LNPANPYIRNMYITGFIQTDRPRVLIDPVSCRTVEELHTWLIGFFNKNDYSLDNPISKEAVEAALKQGKPVRINIAGYKVAAMFGQEEVINAATDSFKHID
jgi:hypothetical protein